MKTRNIFPAVLLLALLAVFALDSGRRSSRGACVVVAGQTLSADREAERRVETPPSLFTMPSTVCVPGAETVRCGWRTSGNGPRSGTEMRRAPGLKPLTTHNVCLIGLLKKTVSPHANRDYHVYRLRRIVI